MRDLVVRIVRTPILFSAAIAMAVLVGCSNSPFEMDDARPAADDSAQVVLGSPDNPGVVEENAADSDDVWIVDGTNASVVRLDTEGNQFVSVVEVGGIVSDLAVGDGGVWVVDKRRRDIYRIDIEDDSIRLVRHFDDEAPDRIEVAGNGHVWFSGSRTDGKVVKMSASGDLFGAVALGGRVDDIVVGDGPDGVTGSGAVWVTSRSMGKVVRIDPAAVVTDAEVVVEGDITAVTTGAGGVWLAVRNPTGRGGVLHRIDPVSAVITWSHEFRWEIDGLAVDGAAVWVSQRTGDALARVDSDTMTVQDESLRILDPAELVAGPGGLWAITDYGEALTLVDAAGAKAVGTLRAGVILSRLVSG